MLILLLIMTLSLLIGISLQHFQLLRKFLDTKAELEKENIYKFSTPTTLQPETTTDKYRIRMDAANFDENTIPK